MSSSKIEVKTLDSSDLSPDEIAKAIEKTAISSTSKKKTDTAATGHLETKVESDKSTDTAAAESDAVKAPMATSKSTDSVTSSSTKTEDGATAIIVKRKSGYVQAAGSTSTQPTATPENLSVLTDTAPAQALRPPSQRQKVVTVPIEETMIPRSAPKEETTTDTTVEKESTDEVSKEHTPTARPVNSTATSNSPISGEIAQTIAKQAKKINEASAKSVHDNPLQNPTVFDTTQYHLPIKARSRRYVNSAVAWLLLLIVLIGASAYVLWQLGVIMLEDIKPL